MNADFEQIKAISNVFDPSRPLKPEDPAYVDCREVRGDSNIEVDLGRKIIFAMVSDENDTSTCQLYAGHRGAGKSTELLRLQKYLEENQCFVVYFSADNQDIDSEDAQYTDILLACTRHLLEDLRDSNSDPILHWLRDRWQALRDLSLTEVSLEKLNIQTAIATFGKITADLRAVPSQRAKIRSLVEPHTTTLLKALNEFIDEAKKQLPLGKTKLVIIADSLDRITPTIQEDGRTNHDQIFIDRSQQLKGLDCHVIYTVPISLLYSTRANDIYDNYGNTEILPMIKVRERDGSICQTGLEKLKEVIAKRVKQTDPNLELVPQVFDNNEILEKLCMISGGHIRQLIQLTQEALIDIDRLPITAKAAQRAITKLRDVYSRTVDEDQWSILAKVSKSKEIENRDEYRELLFNRCLLEYIDGDGENNRWCDIHPLIKDISKFQTALQALENTQP